MGYPEQWNKRSGIPKREQGMEEPISMAEVALKYASRGWHVFSLAKNGKVPIANSHGLCDATTDTLLISAMWANEPEANIGLATGAASGIIIVDLDPRNGSQESLIELEKRYGKLPSTLLVRTPRNGIHRYFKYPQDGKEYGSTVQLDHLPGIDVRGEGGYALLPPSTLFAGKASYKFVKSDFPIAKSPDWLLKLIQKSDKVDTIRREGNFEAKGDKWLLDAIGRASEGNRNQVGFYLACQLRDDGLSESEARNILLEYAHAVQQGKTLYREAEALASLASAYKRKPRPPARR